MVALKSVAGPAGSWSVKVATPPLKVTPSVAVMAVPVMASGASKTVAAAGASGADKGRAARAAATDGAIAARGQITWRFPLEGVSGLGGAGGRVYGPGRRRIWLRREGPLQKGSVDGCGGRRNQITRTVS